MGNISCRSRGVARRRDLHSFEARQEAAALADRLLVREYLLYVFELRSRLRKKLLVHEVLRAPCDVELVLAHHVVYFSDRTVVAVLDRKDAVSAHPAFNSREYALERAEIHQLRSRHHLEGSCLRMRAGYSLHGYDSRLGEELRCVLHRSFYRFKEAAGLREQAVLVSLARVEDGIVDYPRISRVLLA